METLIDWLCGLLLTNLLFFYLYLRERRKRKAWQVIVNAYQSRIRNFTNQYLDLVEGKNVKQEIDDIIEDIENP